VLRAAAAAPPAAAPAQWPDPGQIAVDAGLATRAPDNSVVFAPPPGVAHVARQEAAAPAPASAPPPAAGPAAAAGAGHDRFAPDLGELADQLYGRIEQRLRADLFAERERRGALPDF
jgi:hypothetical protein